MIHRLIQNDFELSKENRLIFLAEKDDSKAEPKSDVDRRLEPEKQRQKHLDELRKKVNSDTGLSGGSKALALTAINSEDEDEIALVEKLVDPANPMQQNEFRKKLEKLREEKQKLINRADGTRSQVKRTKAADEYKEYVPSVEEQERFPVIANKMQQLNKAELGVKDNISKKLEKHVKKGEISNKDAHKLASLDPRDPRLGQMVKELLGPLAKDNSLKNYIIQEKSRQADIVNQFEQLWAEADKLIEKSIIPYKLEKLKRQKLKFVTRKLGIDLKEGQQLEFLCPKPGGSKAAIANINAIHFTKFMPDQVRAGEIVDDEEFKKILRDEEPGFPKNLVIEMSYELPDGTTTTETFTEERLQMWLNQYRATEVVKSISEVEHKIGFAAFGQTLSEQQTFEYTDGVVPGTNQPNFATAKILKIDRTNNTIQLDKPVQYVGQLERNADKTVPHASKKDTLTYGEFVKWFNLTRAEEQMNLETARDKLKKMPQHLKNKYPDVDPSIWEFNDTPIELKKGEKLLYGDNKTMQITNVDPNEIRLSNGLKLTPGQFLRFVKEHEIERADKLPGKEDIEDKLKKAVDNEAQAAAEEQKEVEPTGTKDRIGPLTMIWKNTQMLSLKDLWQIVQTTKDYVKRKHERNIKRRAGQVGSNLPGRLGSEFQNLSQGAEDQEVNEYKEKMKDMSIWTIKGRLHETSNYDEAKACIMLLSEKGLMDFEDPKNWATMNRILKSNFPNKYTQFRIDPKTKKNADGEKGIAAFRTLLDIVYGEPSGTDWYNQSDSKYTSEVNTAKSDAKKYENDYAGTGGVAAELHNMLVKHMSGKYVSPHRFEAFINFIIDAGKASIEDKFYYLIAGITLKNSRGETILSKARHADIEGDYLNRLPLLDYLTRYKRPGDDQPLSIEYCNELMSEWKFYPKVNKRNAAERYNKSAVTKFIWEKTMTHNQVLKRLNKGMRNAEQMDHDDADLLIPLAGEGLIKSAVLGRATGTKTAFTLEGYKNGFPGFTEYMLTLSNITQLPPAEQEMRLKHGFEKPGTLMTQAVKSFVTFESAVTGRNLYSLNPPQLDTESLDSYPIVDDAKTVRGHLEEMRAVVREILLAYGMPQKTITAYLEGTAKGKSHEEKQNQESFMENFSSEIDRMTNFGKNVEPMIKAVNECVRKGILKGRAGEDLKGNLQAQEKLGTKQAA